MYHSIVMKYSKDALTELPDRSALVELESCFRSRKSSVTWSVIMADVDHFKLINDIYGHLQGDQVLKIVASLLRINLRQGDFIVRFGGDEFLCIMPDTGLEEALSVSERIMSEVQRSSLSKGIKFSISLGVAESSDQEPDFAVLIHRADKALYQAKDQGRGRISFKNTSPPDPHGPILKFHHFVGRQPELKKLRQLWDETLTEGSRIAIIQGEAGAGKTRLAMELTQYANYIGALVLKSEFFELGQTEPYTVLIQPLKELSHLLSPDEFSSLLKSIESIHPATAELMPFLETIIGPDTQFFREDRLKFRVFNDISRIFHHLSQIKPLMLILDDLQWIGDPDWELLTYLIRTLSKGRILFSVTLRTSTSKSNCSLNQVNLLRRFIPTLLLDLKKLSQTETSNLVMFALKDPNVPQELLQLIHNQSGGNPFFIRELVTSFQQNQALVMRETGEWSYYIPSQISLPESLHQLISSRLSILSDQARRLLRIGALCSQQFSLALLSFVADISIYELTDILDSAIKAGILDEVRSSEQSPLLRFSHDTVRQYLLRELSESSQTHLHAKMAEFYEMMVKNGNEDAISAMAYHFTNSSITSKAREASLKAAHRFFRLNAYREAVNWGEKYLSFCQAEAESSYEMVDLQILLGKLYSNLGNGKKATEILKQALDSCHDEDQRINALSLLGSNYQKMSCYPKSRQCYESALALSSQKIIQADLLSSLAFIDYLIGHLDESEKTLDLLEKKLKEIPVDTEGYDRVRASYCTSKGILEQYFRPSGDGIKYHEEALQLYQKYGDLLGESTALNNLADIHFIESDFEKTLAVLHRSEDLCYQLDHALGLAIAWYNLAETYLEINESNLAREYYQRYLEVNEQIGNKIGSGFGKFGLGELAKDAGKFSDAVSFFESAAKIFFDIGAQHLNLQSRLKMIECWSLSGNFDRSQAELDAIEPESLEDLPWSISSEWFYINGLNKILNSELPPDIRLHGLNDLTHSLHQEYAIPFSKMIRRYFYAIQGCRWLNNSALMKEIQSKAQKRLNHTIRQTTSFGIRENILSHPVTQLLIQAIDDTGL